ncbi:MAG: hypothetical protein OMM_05635 [Candidatus Magnetoglobus multicellularis str. Araruama]|uniref:Sulfatase-modifying factor enzyme-like domain-containing protein n=1 Tax=Candidatus Magnetoglobus multicellularis str. Araruama TaxID=890399 RepID=A0A1V1NV52_9BACT|nr:MAG: hypothetical protein OMM_05635 [Candidatus Magnetoglobus multicellularis str. Araruama]
MHGNAMEWCSDYYGYYPETPVTDPKGPESGLYHVVRGGAYYSMARYCRSASRSFQSETYQGRSFGFRLAASPFSIQKIPLYAGWNLISFGINKCFYVGTKPNAPMIDNISYVKVDHIMDILHSIDGAYKYIRAYDCTGAKSYEYGSLWSDMTYMAAGYGYWIYIKEDANFENGLIYLELEGEMASVDKIIQLRSNQWALMGVLGNTAFCQDNVPDYVDFPSDTKIDFVSSMADVFQSINDQYILVKGKYKNGSYVFTPDDIQHSDLKCISPGFGYIVKINQDQNPTVNFVWKKP